MKKTMKVSLMINSDFYKLLPGISSATEKKEGII